MRRPEAPTEQDFADLAPPIERGSPAVWAGYAAAFLLTLLVSHARAKGWM